jgi:hypothetical protein
MADIEEVKINPSNNTHADRGRYGDILRQAHLARQQRAS